MTDTPRVAVCVPCHDRWHADFGACLVDAMVHYTRQGGLVGLIMAQGSLIHAQRDDLVREAKKSDATHILWLDADQTFPADLIGRLLAHDAMVVGANIPRRVWPYTPCAFADGQPVYTMAWHTGTQDVDTLGLGITLMKIGCFPGDGPFFSFGWDPEKKEPIGEDVGLFRNLAEAGIRPVIDHDLSKEIGHLGTVKVTNDLAAKARVKRTD